jgi:hypothetical protein
VVVLCIVVLVTSMCLFPVAARAGVCCILLRLGRLVGNQLGSSILCFFLVDVSFFFVVSFGPLLRKRQTASVRSKKTRMNGTSECKNKKRIDTNTRKKPNKKYKDVNAYRAPTV